MYGAKQALHNASVSYKFDYEESVKRCLGEALFIGFGAPEVRKCEVVSEKVVVQTLDKPLNEPADKPAVKPLNKPADKPINKPADKPINKPINKPADKPADKPSAVDVADWRGGGWWGMERWAMHQHAAKSGVQLFKWNGVSYLLSEDGVIYEDTNNGGVHVNPQWTRWIKPAEKQVVKQADKPLNEPLNEPLNKPTAAAAEEEDAPEIVVRVFKWNGVSYLRSVVGGVIYDKFTNEPLGVWNAKENNIEFDGPESEDELMTDISDEGEGEGEGEVAPKASTVGRVRNNIDREATRDAIPDRMVLRASGANPKQKGNDVVLDVIYRASTKTFYRYGKGVKTEYKTLQDANREWCMTRNGHTKLENAWTAFKALDREGILKPKAINELHTAGGNWTTNISHVTLNRFIDKTFKF